MALTTRSEVVRMLQKQCACYFDHEGQEYWKCVPCEARDYIQLLTSRMEEVGCQHCNSELKEMLE